MNISSLIYLIKEGIKSLIHNKLMTLASIGVLTASLLVVGFSTLISKNLNKTVDFFGEQNSAIVYLKDGTTQEQINELTTVLNNNNKIKNTVYTSKEQALKDFSQKFNNNDFDQLLLERNVLPASIDIIVNDVEFMNEISNIVSKFDFIESTQIPSQVTEFIKKLEKKLAVFESLLVIILIVVSLVIISNTIRATVFARRREIAIMKQVGATDNFVSFPFIVEGIIIGVLSALIAFIIINLAYKAILMILLNIETSFLSSIFANFVDFKKISLVVALYFLIGGIGAGIIGSMFSLKKYLKA